MGRPIFGDYQVEGELGRGGMGVVFRARQKKLNRLVALKMLTGHYGADELTRFLAEAETAASLHHTNIVQIYEVGEDKGAPFFSMEYVESGSLADRLRTGMMPPREAAQLLISVARALHFAHQNGVVHRDMKPANVLLDPDGVPKVTDFGIAKRLKSDTSLTLSGAVIGTPTYMAPEQAKGTSRDVGAAADVYALGAILYEMLSGRPPFLPEDSETAVTVRVITEDPVSPAFYRPGIPRDLETICMKCLEKEPRDRYASAAAFAEDLRRFLDDESILAPADHDRARDEMDETPSLENVAGAGSADLPRLRGRAALALGILRTRTMAMGPGDRIGEWSCAANSAIDRGRGGQARHHLSPDPARTLGARHQPRNAQSPGTPGSGPRDFRRRSFFELGRGSHGRAGK